MKKIVIGFSRPKHCTLFSKLIMAVQGTNYSHTYIIFKSESLNRKLVYQASGLQVNFVGGKLFYEKYIPVKEFEFEISDDSHLNTLRFAVDKAGVPYSIKQLFRILYYMITGNSTPGDEREAYVCSELIAQIMQDQFGIMVNKNLDIVVPKDLFKILSEIYG